MAVPKQTVVLRAVLVALKIAAQGVQAAILSLQAAVVVVTVTPTSSKQRFGVECRDPKAIRVSDLDEEKGVRLCAKSAQYTVRDNLRKIIKNNFDTPKKPILKL